MLSGKKVLLTPPWHVLALLDSAPCLQGSRSRHQPLEEPAGFTGDAASRCALDLWVNAVMAVQVLLVEPCDMVRQVNQLALRAWGTSVCAVKTEDEAISRLKLRGEFHLASVAAACSIMVLKCGVGRYRVLEMEL